MLPTIQPHPKAPVPARELSVRLFSSLLPQPPLPHWLFHGVTTFLGSGDLSVENDRDLESLRGTKEDGKL